MKSYIPKGKLLYILYMYIE